jgi:hypothetical protein
MRGRPCALIVSAVFFHSFSSSWFTRHCAALVQPVSHDARYAPLKALPDPTALDWKTKRGWPCASSANDCVFSEFDGKNGVPASTTTVAVQPAACRQLPSRRLKQT